MTTYLSVQGSDPGRWFTHSAGRIEKSDEVHDSDSYGRVPGGLAGARSESASRTAGSAARWTPGRAAGGPAGSSGGGRGPAVPSGPGRSNNPFPTPIPATEGVITVKLRRSSRRSPTSGTRAARMNLLVGRTGHPAPVRQHDDRHALRGQLRRQERHAVSRHQRSEVGNAGAGEQHRAGLPELRVPPAVRAGAARRATASSTPGSTRRT